MDDWLIQVCGDIIITINHQNDSVIRKLIHDNIIIIPSQFYEHFMYLLFTTVMIGN